MIQISTKSRIEVTSRGGVWHIGGIKDFGGEVVFELGGKFMGVHFNIISYD